MIETRAATEWQRHGRFPEALPHKEPATPRSGARARAGDTNDRLEAAWAFVGEAVGGLRADHRRALDMMCD